MSAAADPLREGDRGGRVVELQLLLRMTGHDPGPVDGIFGERTFYAANEAYSMVFEAPPVGWRADVPYLRQQPRLAIEMPRVSTPTSEEELRLAIGRSYVEVVRPSGPDGTQVGVPQMRNAVLVALAHLAVEHGATYAAIHTFNVGNIQVPHQQIDGRSSLPRVPWFDLVSKEVLTVTDKDGKIVRREVDMKSPYPAFANLLEGATAYWTFLRDHCSAALARFESGDPAGAAHELKVGVWHYSGSEADYTRGMVDSYHRISKLAGGLDPEPQEPG